MKKLEFFLKNLLLRILLLSKKSQGAAQNNKFDQNSKILFIRLNRIGDALVTTPLLHEIKESLKCKIYVLADRKNFVAYGNNRDIDKLIIFERGVKGFFDILNFIKNEKIDTVVDLHDDVSTTVSFLIALCRANNKFGLEKDNKIIYTKTIPKLDAQKVHVVDRLVEIKKLFNLYPGESNPGIRYYLTNDSIDKAELFLSANFPVSKFLIGINISAGSKARFWGMENYRSLIKFLSGYNVNILVLSSPPDTKAAVEISGGDYVNFYSTDFGEFAAIISKLNFLFTPDTAVVHLASAFEIPMFGIYVKYNTTDMIWSPYNLKYESVITTNYNLEEITIEQVICKLKPYLENILHEYRISN